MRQERRDRGLGGLGEAVRRGRFETTACRLAGAAALVCRAARLPPAPHRRSAVGPQATAAAARQNRPRRRCRRRCCASTSASSPPMAASTTIRGCKRMLEQTVERLVAASERPDLHYKVTMLNSQSINAFALPTGQLYVTRGLIALANDESELASVLGARDGPRDRAPRRASAKNRPSKPRWSAASSATSSAIRKRARWRSPNRSSRWRASRARRNSRPTPSASAIAARAGYDPYGAVRFLSSMEHNSELKPQQTAAHQSARARLPVVASGDARSASPTRIANARQYSGAPRRDHREHRCARQGRLSRRHRRHRVRRGSERRFRARPPLPASAAGLHFHRAGRLHPRQHRAGRARRQARRRPGAAARCGARAGRADARRLSDFRLDREYRSQHASKTSPSTVFRAPPRRPKAINGTSAFTPSASAATSTASFSPPSIARPKPIARSANRSARSAA